MCAARGGTRRCIVIDTCSFGDSSPKMCSRHGPYPFCVCPRSFNQALLLSTRWMFGRVNRMVVIGRFGAFFGRRRLVADADTGWSSAACTRSSAALTDATGCMLQHTGDAGQSARVKLRVVSQRACAIWHCLQQRSMRAQATAHLFLRALLACRS